jgi:hypothetical protein
MLRLSRKYRNEVSNSVAGPHLAHLAYDGSQSLFVDPTSTMKYCRKEHDEKCLRS